MGGNSSFFLTENWKLYLAASPGKGSGNPLQHSCLGNLMERGGAWQASVHGVTKSDMTEQLTSLASGTGGSRAQMESPGCLVSCFTCPVSVLFSSRPSSCCASSTHLISLGSSVEKSPSFLKVLVYSLGASSHWKSLGGCYSLWRGSGGGCVPVSVGWGEIPM